MTEANAAEPRDVLVCVDPAKLDQIWPHVRHFIHVALFQTIGDETLESLEAQLRAGTALLWVVWDGRGLIAAAVTTLLTVPTGKVCLIAACGGRELPRWKRFLGELEQYAKHEGCQRMRVLGRPGWKAILTDYREPWCALEKDLT